LLEYTTGKHWVMWGLGSIGYGVTVVPQFTGESGSIAASFASPASPAPLLDPVLVAPPPPPELVVLVAPPLPPEPVTAAVVVAELPPAPPVPAELVAELVVTDAEEEPLPVAAALGTGTGWMSPQARTAKGVANATARKRAAGRDRIREGIRPGMIPHP